MIDGINAYIDGTTEPTIHELAQKHGFDAHVIRKHKSELDVIFERDNLESVPEGLCFDSQITANAFSMLDDLVGSGCELRATQVFTTKIREVEPILNGLDIEVDYETIY